MGWTGLVLFLLGLVFLAPPITDLFSASWGMLYFPEEYAAKPPPKYDTAEGQVKQGRYTEAMTLYEQIIRDDPDEVRAYIGIIDMAIVHLNNPGLASYVYQRGLAVMKKPEARDTLTRMYTGISSRLDAKPDWQQKHSISMEGHPLNPFPHNTSDRDVPSAPR